MDEVVRDPDRVEAGLLAGDDQLANFFPAENPVPVTVLDRGNDQAYVDRSFSHSWHCSVVVFRLPYDSLRDMVRRFPDERKRFSRRQTKWSIGKSKRR